MIIVLFTYIIFQNRFNFSHWKDIKLIQSPVLRGFASKLPYIAEASKSKNTVKKYCSSFRRFRFWCLNHDLSSLPASVTTIAIYLAYFIQSEMFISGFYSAYYSIKWEHELNLYNSVYSYTFLNLILEGGVRILSKPTVKKEPIISDIIKAVLRKFKPDKLPNLRMCCLMLLGYTGALRYNELVHIKANNLQLFSSHVEVVIESSKTDIYRQRNTIVIARTNSEFSPVAILEKYLKQANISLSSDEFIFISLFYLKSKNIHMLSKTNKPLSYTIARELLLNALSDLGLDKKKFGLHSLRSGFVSQAAHNCIPERLLKSHGRWKSDIAKEGHTKESLNNKLSVSKNLKL